MPQHSQQGGLFDPVLAWEEMSPRRRREIGVAAIAVGKGIWNTKPSPTDRRMQALSCQAVEEALLVIQRVMIDQDQSVFDHPRIVAVGSLGIRQCRSCGCTDEVACYGGCSWITADRCSACASAAISMPMRATGQRA